MASLPTKVTDSVTAPNNYTTDGNSAHPRVRACACWLGKSPCSPPMRRSPSQTLTRRLRRTRPQPLPRAWRAVPPVAMPCSIKPPARPSDAHPHDPLRVVPATSMCLMPLGTVHRHCAARLIRRFTRKSLPLAAASITVGFPSTSSIPLTARATCLTPSFGSTIFLSGPP